MITWLQGATLVMQFFILFAVGWSAVSAWSTWKVIRQTRTLIEGYRRELGWLMARLDALESQRRVGP
jgi:hypothetical protein